MTTQDERPDVTTPTTSSNAEVSSTSATEQCMREAEIVSIETVRPGRLVCCF